MHLTRATIKRILETASRHIRRDLTGASFTMVCTVEEGPACRFASADWSDQTLAPLVLDIVDEIGWKSIEHAARRQVVIRCTVPAIDPAGTRLECDRGDGFVSVEVAEA